MRWDVSTWSLMKWSHNYADLNTDPADSDFIPDSSDSESNGKMPTLSAFICNDNSNH